MKQVSQYAFKDITQYFNNNKGIDYKKDNPRETWNVRPSHLNNKETRRLNRELGLGGINKIQK